jgi:hypothetical protein
MARRRLSAIALLAALILGPAQAQQPPPPVPRDAVVVTGKAIEDEVRALVSEIAKPEGGEDQLARWDRSVCPGIVGLDARHAQMVLGRIARRAQAVDLTVGKPGCRANIMIIIARDPGAVARELADKAWRAMGTFQSAGETTLGRKALQAFRESKAPVRWWFVGDIVIDGGRKVGETYDGSAPFVQIYGASLLGKQTRTDFARAFLIVDARQIDGVVFGALADYLAMVSLAQIDADADTSGYASILNLFAARAKGETLVAEMTAWDLAYLEGLYKTQRTASSAKAQERDIARRMSDAIAPE